MTATAKCNAPQLAAVTHSTAAEADIQAENAAVAQAHNDLLTQIMQGSSQDPWFEKTSNLAWLDLHQGL